MPRETMIPVIRESALKNKASLLRFIAEFDGASP